ncbi:MAG: acyl-CoA dehydrogenase family protein, partial [Acidimicrobiales bacterium]
MGHYKSNLRDIEFTLFEVLERGDVLGHGRYADVDVETARSILAEVDRLARDELSDSYADGDRNPPVYDPNTRSLTLPDTFKATFRTLMDAEFYRFALPVELGGQPVPPSLYWAGAELILGANAATWMYATG